MQHEGRDGGRISHPYQVLLRLVGRKPGITPAKCALALEAHDDSPEELDRIVALVDLPEDEIRTRIGVSKPTWDNAKKVLPKFAEQLGDVIRQGNSYTLADAPGRADAGPAQSAAPIAAGGNQRTVRVPRTARRVTPETIGQAGIADRSDEVQIPPDLDPQAAAEAIAVRLDRLRRHNFLLRDLARHLYRAGAEITEQQYDMLALVPEHGYLVEVKTLDGTDADEREQVQRAAAQLLYYEAFVTPPVVGNTAVSKIACFEQPITGAHRQWLNHLGIAAIWKNGDSFSGDDAAEDFLRRYIEAED
jgi:hypothetical protein